MSYFRFHFIIQFDFIEFLAPDPALVFCVHLPSLDLQWAHLLLVGASERFFSEPISLWIVFLACWRIHFGRVLTRAFIPSLWLDEGHCLYLQNDFPLFSFIPAFLPSSTPGHESENLTPRRRGRRTVGRGGRQIQKEGGGGEDIWRE